MILLDKKKLIEKLRELLTMEKLYPTTPAGLYNKFYLLSWGIGLVVFDIVKINGERKLLPRKINIWTFFYYFCKFLCIIKL